MIAGTTASVLFQQSFFGFHKIILLRNLDSRELSRILENFHFSISVSKHFDFTFHFSKKSESIFFTLHFPKKSEGFYFSLFTSRAFQTHSRWGMLLCGSSDYKKQVIRKQEVQGPLDEYYASPR